MAVDDKTRATDIKVGIFVTLGIVTLVFVVFLIGQERHFFERPVFLNAHFENVSGLKVGAPVRLAGVDVGIVSRIEFPPVIEGAENRVAEGVDLGDPKYGKPPPRLKVEGTRGEIDGWQLPLQSDLVFETPTRAVVTLIGVAKPGEIDSKVTAQVLVVGKDQWGQHLSEHIKAEVSSGTRTRIVGTVPFSRIDTVVLRYVADADRGERVLVGTDPQRKITVNMRIRADSLDRIRRGSRAKVDSMGLLGDKTIDITMGLASEPAHKDGDTLLTVPNVDLFAEVSAGVAEIKSTFAGAGDVIQTFLEAGGREKINELLDIVNALGEEVQHGEGLVHQLIYDDTSEGRYKLKEVIASINAATRKVNRTLDDVDGFVEEVKTGDGVIHEAVYGKGGEATLQSAKQTLEEARQLLADVRTKQGIVHQLIYTEDKGETIADVQTAIADLKAASADIKTASSDAREVVAEVKRGEGTLGALIKDPTVYEDLKTLLGNAKRNDAVKALVRYAIEREDQIATPK